MNNENTDNNNSDKEKGVTDMLGSDGSVIDDVLNNIVAPIYTVAFAGFTERGQSEDAVSRFNGDLSEWMNDAKARGVIFDHFDHSYNPEVTALLDVSAIGDNANEQLSLEIPAGLIPIFGGTGSGKSKLTNYITKVLDGEFIRFGEPEIPSMHSPMDIIRIIREFLNGPNKIMAIDSFRPFFYMTTKKASIGKGGVNNALYMDFTALSSICTMAGKTLFVVINPLTTMKDDAENVRSNLESSTVGLINVTSYGRFSYVARTTQNERKLVQVEVNMSSVDTLENRGGVGSTGKKKKSSIKDHILDDMVVNSGANPIVDPWLRILADIKNPHRMSK